MHSLRYLRYRSGKYRKYRKMLLKPTTNKSLETELKSGHRRWSHGSAVYLAFFCHNNVDVLDQEAGQERSRCLVWI